MFGVRVMVGVQNGPFTYKFENGAEAGCLYLVEVTSGEERKFFFASQYSECEKHLKGWTPERIQRYFSKDPLYWSLSHIISRKGWLTPNARRRLKRRLANFPYPIPFLDLRDEDFCHGITLDWAYDVVRWQVHGNSFKQNKEDPWWEDSLNPPPRVIKQFEVMSHIQARLESEDCPAPIRKWYKEFPA